jgi:hypothetical protein
MKMKNFTITELFRNKEQAIETNLKNANLLLRPIIFMKQVSHLTNKTTKSFLVLLLLLLFSALSFKAFAQAPTISSFTPTSGPVGTLVTITGTNLSSPTALSIGGVSAIEISNTGNSLVAMVMPVAATGAISITTVGGTANATGNFTVTASQTPNTQQGSKLVGTGAVGNAVQGRSISISADGNTALVGGDNDNSGAGAAWVYTRSGGTWSQQGSKLVGTGASSDAQQGFSVSISADGNTAIVGGYFDNFGVGAAWVYTRSGGTWSQQGSKLVGTGAVVANQGYSVSISADGNTAIVGGNYDDFGVGAAWVYTRSGGTWSQQGSKLVGTGAVGAAYQGQSVSISADGNTAMVGGSLDNGAAGAAWVYTRSGGTWSQQGSKLVGTGAWGIVAYQGTSVSISADGNTAIVGGNQDNVQAGAAWVYTRSGGTWSQQGSKLVGTGAVAAEQGWSVSISADGNTALVGGYTDNGNAGAAWVYTRSGGTWSQQGSKLVGTGAVGAAYQGYSVSISADGNTAVVGGLFDNSQAGAAWVYNYAPPLAIIATGTLSAFTSCAGTASAEQTFTVSGSNLTANLVVTPPTDFEVSTTSGSGFASNVSLPFGSGTVATTTIYIRLTNAASGTPSGNVACTSTGATTQNVAANGTVNANPTATIVTTDASGTTNDDGILCSGASATLNSSTSIAGSGSISSRLWSNGGETTSSVTRNAAGPSTVTITNSNGCLTTSSASTIIVNANPTATIVTIDASGTTNDDGILCSGASATLNSSTSTAGSGSISAYLWSNGGETTSSVTRNAAGSSTVTITNSNGCVTTSTASTTIVVNANPTATIVTTDASGTTNDDGILCSGASATLNSGTSTAGSGSITAYLWSNGGETTSSVTRNAAGSSTVTITNSNGCVTTSTASTTIVVNANPTATIVTTDASGTTNDDGILCSGASATLNSSTSIAGSGSISSRLWSNGGETTSSVTRNAAGPSTVTITNSNGCLTTSSASTIIVNANPTATIVTIDASGTTNDDGILCSGASATLNSSTSTAGSGSISAYLWSNGGETTSSVTRNAAGSLTVTITNSNGCLTTSSASTTIVVNTNPIASFSVNDIDQCLTPNSFDLLSTSTNGTGAINAYAWTAAGASIAPAGADPDAYTYAAAGSPTVTLQVTDVNGCSNTSSATNLTVWSNPTASFTINDFDQCLTGNSFSVNSTSTNGNGTINTWVWSAIGASPSLTAVATPPAFAYATRGAKTVNLTVTDNNGCTNATANSGNITVWGMPTASFTINDNTQCLIANSFTLTNTSTNSLDGSINAYAWSTAAGTPSSFAVAGPNVVTYASFGDKTVNLQVTDNNGCVHATAFTNNVNVYGHPTAAFVTTDSSVIVNDFNICTGSVVNFTGASSTPGAYPGSTLNTGLAAFQYKVSNQFYLAHQHWQMQVQVLMQAFIRLL